jgi:hypothetical protein
VTVANDDAMGYSAMHFRTLMEVFGPELNASIGNPRRKRDLWDDLQGTTLPLPMRTILLASQTNTRSSWVTNDGDDAGKLRTADPTEDVYNRLGLDWTGRSERITNGVPKARAVLLCCPLRVRERTAGALCCPNAIDGWGNMLFISRRVTGSAWPDHGSATARPGSDDPCLPEAIHGPPQVTEGDVSVMAAGEINIGNRPVEFGNDAMSRAIRRLRIEALGA